MNESRYSTFWPSCIFSHITALHRTPSRLTTLLLTSLLYLHPQLLGLRNRSLNLTCCSVPCSRSHSLYRRSSRGFRYDYHNRRCYKRSTANMNAENRNVSSTSVNAAPNTSPALAGPLALPHSVDASLFTVELPANGPSYGSVINLSNDDPTCSTPPALSVSTLPQILPYMEQTTICHLTIISY